LLFLNEKEVVMVSFLRIYSVLGLMVVTSVFAETKEQQTKRTLLPMHQYLSQDELWLSAKDDMHDNDIKTVAVYFNGRTTQDVTQGQVDTFQYAIENKIQNTGFTVRTCIECTKQRVHLSKKKIKYKTGIENNQELRSLGKNINVDAFLVWRLSKNFDGYDLNMKIINAHTNKVVWIRSFQADTAAKEIKEIKYPSQWGVAIGHLGLKGEANIPFNPNIDGSGQWKDRFSTVRDISIRYYTRHKPGENLHYAIIGNFFMSVPEADQTAKDLKGLGKADFSVQGVGLEGRVLYNFSQDTFLNPSAYVGVGISSVNERQKISARTGFEFAFMENAFVDVGLIYIDPVEYEFKENNWSQDKAKFADSIGTDFTIGIRF